MTQIILAIVVIGFFLAKLFWQEKKGEISKNEYSFWLVFWLAALVIVLSLKFLDKFVAQLGFSASAIQVLLYLSVAVLFYFIFRVRLRLDRMDEQLTKLVEELAIKKGK